MLGQGQNMHSQKSVTQQPYPNNLCKRLRLQPTQAYANPLVSSSFHHLKKCATFGSQILKATIPPKVVVQLLKQSCLKESASAQDVLDITFLAGTGDVAETPSM